MKLKIKAMQLGSQIRQIQEEELEQGSKFKLKEQEAKAISIYKSQVTSIEQHIIEAAEDEE